MNTMQSSLTNHNTIIPAIDFPHPASVKKTTRAQWSGLWRSFRAMRALLGEREALILIEKYCKRDA